MCLRILIFFIVHGSTRRYRLDWIKISDFFQHPLLCFFPDAMKLSNTKMKRNLCVIQDKKKRKSFTPSHWEKKTELLIDGQATLKAIWPRKKRSVLKAICRKSRKYVDILWTTWKPSYFFCLSFILSVLLLHASCHVMLLQSLSLNWRKRSGWVDESTKSLTGCLTSIFPWGYKLLLRTAS